MLCLLSHHNVFLLLQKQGLSHEHRLLCAYESGHDVLDWTQPPPPLTEDNDWGAVARDKCTKLQISELMDSLPRNLHWDKDHHHLIEEEEEQAVSRPLETLDEDEEDEHDSAKAAEEGLKNAWQYRKSVQEERQGRGKTRIASSSPGSRRANNVFCHSFDLSGRLKEQDWNPGCVRMVEIDGAEGSPNACGFRAYQQLVDAVQKEMDESTDSLVRLLLYQADSRTISIALPLLLAHIRLNKLPVVVMVSVKPWAASSQGALCALRRASDAVLQTEGFASRIHYPPPAEFRHLHGLLLLPKVSTATAATAVGHYGDMTVSKRPPAHVYGLKRDRRKLHVPLLHIPPEDYAGSGGSVGSGAVRSGAGRPKDAKTAAGGCGSAANSVLDF